MAQIIRKGREAEELLQDSDVMDGNGLINEAQCFALGIKRLPGCRFKKRRLCSFQVLFVVYARTQHCSYQRACHLSIRHKSKNELVYT